MLLLALFFGLAAAHLEYVLERPCDREWGNSYVCSSVRSTVGKIMVPQRRIIIARPRLAVQKPCCPRVLEHNAPQYNVETKVAAPVYILPKHGPVMNKGQELTKPKEILREQPVVLRPARLILRQPALYRHLPIIFPSRTAIDRPCFDEYTRENLWI
uniref:Secreted protein n=1 Tax=Syphacia muris TaxID=451379 RepID=A0A0N5AJ23_9BILA